MATFYHIFFLMSILISMVLCDITSPVNYQPIKYSHIHLEVNYLANNGYIRKEFDFTQQNILVTVINSKTSIHVFGRLIVVKSDEKININSTITSRMAKLNGACSRITTMSEVPWIAIVLSGGKCSTKTKLDNVLRRSNASAVIIIDNFQIKTADRYEFNNQIGIRLSELLIPINILLNESIFINASIIVNNFFVDGFISRTSVLFVSISFILLMFISLVWLIFYYIQRFRYIHAKERLSRRLANAAKKALDKIPLKVLAACDKEVSNDYDQCAICIDSYSVGDTIRILPCKHIFHKVCIDSWLIEQRSCPMCKVDILKACGVLNVFSSEKTSLVNQAVWINNTTVTGNTALLDSGLNDESLALESIVGLHHSSRWRRGHSTFLQRYRERYGIQHCHRGHRRDHFRKISRHFHEHRCIYNNTKSSLMPTDHVSSTDEVHSHRLPISERTDLILESEPPTVNIKSNSLHISIPSDQDQFCNAEHTFNQIVHHDTCNVPEKEICECSSDNTTGECDVYDPIHHTSRHASTECSCETCSECIHSDAAYNRCNTQRLSQGASIGNLLKCCVTSNTTPNNIHNNPISGLYCCHRCTRNQSTDCSYCNNTISSDCKDPSSKSTCHYPLKIHNGELPETIYLRSHSNNYMNMSSIKSMNFVKNVDKSATMDSYTKSSISDDFDYCADNGSSSIELSAPATKLTVLPPQVQCHRGPQSGGGTQSIDDTTVDDNYPTIDCGSINTDDNH